MADSYNRTWPGGGSATRKSFTDYIPVLKRLILLDSTKRLQRLPVLFNPNSLGLGVEVGIGSLNPVGSSHPVLQYHHTEAVTFDLELYWSAFAMHAMQLNSQRDLQTIIGWLASFCFPLTKGVSPAPLILIWPNTLSMLVAVTSFHCNYRLWDTNSNPRLVEIKLGCQELRQASRYQTAMFYYGFHKSDEGHSTRGLGYRFNPGQRGRGPQLGGAPMPSGRLVKRG